MTTRFCHVPNIPSETYQSVSSLGFRSNRIGSDRIGSDRMDLISPDLISSPILHGPSDSLFTTKRFFFLGGGEGGWRHCETIDQEFS